MVVLLEVCTYSAKDFAWVLDLLQTVSCVVILFTSTFCIKNFTTSNRLGQPNNRLLSAYGLQVSTENRNAKNTQIGWEYCCRKVTLRRNLLNFTSAWIIRIFVRLIEEYTDTNHKFSLPYTLQEYSSKTSWIFCHIRSWMHPNTGLPQGIHRTQS